MTELKPLTTYKHTTDILHKLVEEKRWDSEDASLFLNGISDADVVPRSEVAREIFEEIDNLMLLCACDYGYLYHEVAKLKKKYTEGL